MLVPNAWHPLADCLDGTTNVFMVGECSGWVFDAANARVDPRDNGHGFQMGVDQSNTPRGAGTYGDAAGAANAGRCWHETTINQPIGDRIYVATHENNDCCNKPIVSEHPGGSHVAMADGSVRFATNSMDYQNLLNLANREDGNTVVPP
jgi:prepilin-type processing-associated H-X9-DG protein